MGAGTGGERAVVVVEVGAVVHEVWVLLDPGVAGAGGGLWGTARDADVAVSEIASYGDEPLFLGVCQVEATPVITSVLALALGALVFQKSATPRARVRSLMSLRCFFLGGVEGASGIA